MYSYITLVLAEGTARVLSYSHNAEVRVAGKKSNEDPQVLPWSMNGSIDGLIHLSFTGLIDRLID